MAKPFLWETRALQPRTVFSDAPCLSLSVYRYTYYRCIQLQRHQLRGTQVRQREARLAEVRRVYDGSNGIYGARKVWQQLLREGIKMAHGTFERLMRRAHLQGV